MIRNLLRNMKKYILTLIMMAFVAAPMAANAQTDTMAMVDETHIAEQVQGDSDTTGFVGKVLNFYDAHMNYLTIAGLMTIESSFIPFPSEVVIPPAVYVSMDPASTGGMKIWLIVLFGTLGALLGALINYFLSRWLGRPIIYWFVDSKVGHLLLLSGEKMEKAEDYFNKHGNISTLVGRMIPAIRQLISIPAGLAKMNVGSFVFFTTLGALIWNAILVLLGWVAFRAADPSVIKRYSHVISIILIALLVAVVVFFVARAIIRKKKNGQSATQEETK